MHLSQKLASRKAPKPKHFHILQRHSQNRRVPQGDEAESNPALTISEGIHHHRIPVFPVNSSRRRIHTLPPLFSPSFCSNPSELDTDTGHLLTLFLSTRTKALQEFNAFSPFSFSKPNTQTPKFKAPNQSINQTEHKKAQ
ncbi:hypothetical protein VTJ04DRAFT_9129 [Mycothermus thermophilus]|uniref:uncharacterized protein n=1 Tax=Humicola insolens TaxID=85995 RepID=UPI003742D48E